MEQKKAFIKRVQGVTFVGKTDANHWVTMDGPEKVGGSDAGVRPKELVLLALGGCTGMDVESILRKKRTNLAGMELNVTADTAEAYPHEYTKIHVEFVFYGDDLQAKDVERAIELSQTKYCGVTKMLEKAVKIESSYKILPAADA
ncbi:MAG: osmotically inducible protein OsmC [Ignavibacteriales bacterium]|nr:osmotically inducible protein OsmC [Ignavibacteriales bacterium]